MASIFDLEDKLTKKHLMHEGFMEAGWGSPRINKNPEQRFFEKILELNHKDGYPSSSTLQILYFPEEFNGYIYLEPSRCGFGLLKGRFLVQFEGKYDNFPGQERYKIFDANTAIEYKFMMGEIETVLLSMGYKVSKKR